MPADADADAESQKTDHQELATTMDDLPYNEKSGVYWQHRAEALVDCGDRVAKVKTDWDDRREHAIKVAEEMREDGFTASVTSRPRFTTVDLEEVP